MYVSEYPSAFETFTAVLFNKLIHFVSTFEFVYATLFTGGEHCG